jgi:uncharacterized membrane protein YfcA
MELDVLWFLLTLAAAGAVAGITAGLFGNGGGFVVVPALLAVFPFFVEANDELMRVAIGTSLASIVISSARSVQTHRKRGAVDFAVLKDWSMWLLIGVGGGIYIATISSGSSLMIVFATGVLLYSIYFLFPNFFKSGDSERQMPKGVGRAGLASFLGGFSALLGIGGGTITVMTMVFCNRSIHQAVATAAGVGFIIGLPGAIGFMLMGQQSVSGELPFGTVGYVNLPALAAISVASIFTAPIGVHWAHSLNETHLKRLFGIYLVVVSISMYCKALA